MFTLGTARPILWQYASNVAYADATDDDLLSFDSKLAQVLERFFNLGTWRAMWKRPLLTIYGNTLTLPRGFDTCHGVENSCGYPMPIYSRFHEFVAHGPCFLENTSATSCRYPSIGLIDEAAQTFIAPTGTFTLRAVATEVLTDGLNFNGGFDQDGNELFGSITLDLANGTSETTQQFTILPTITKLVTSDAVSLYSVDTTTSDATLIAVYAPGETVPAYRQYIVNGANDSDVVRAQCKLSFVLPNADTDVIVPSNLGALKLGLMSIQFEDKNDPVQAGLYMGPNYPMDNPGKPYGAIDLLDGEAGELREAEIPMFNVSTQYAAGNIYQVK